ncbi:hypothetical protein SAMN05192544_101883 [Paraburkholderia hospita]|nr:hypothetical protein SAMN05192544_101883 [Paraburkholderia hospita]
MIGASENRWLLVRAARRRGRLLSFVARPKSDCLWGVDYLASDTAKMF